MPRLRQAGRVAASARIAAWLSVRGLALLARGAAVERIFHCVPEGSETDLACLPALSLSSLLPTATGVVPQASLHGGVLHGTIAPRIDPIDAR